MRALVQACSRKRVDGQVARGFTRRLWDQALVDKDQSALLQSSAAKARPPTTWRCPCGVLAGAWQLLALQGCASLERADQLALQVPGTAVQWAPV